MSEHETWAVIPTRRREGADAGLIDRCLTSIAPQVDGIVIVDNNDDQAAQYHGGEGEPIELVITHRPGQPPNLSWLINEGIKAVWHMIGARAVTNWPWNLVLLNDDVECVEGWVDSLEHHLRTLQDVTDPNYPAAAYTDRLARTDPVLYQGAIALDYFHTLTGWACMARGELGNQILWDESFHWWYGDNDWDNRLRLELGGVVACPGNAPEHLRPSVQTVASPVLSAQAHLDGVTYQNKWAGRI